MTDIKTEVDQFFESYASALLARDAQAVAHLYAVPSLILFPGQTIAVGDAEQTAAFFSSSWGQYEDVHSIEKVIILMGEAPSTVWADVTWTYGGRAQERFCYQLIKRDLEWQIAVLTPMSL